MSSKIKSIELRPYSAGFFNASTDTLKQNDLPLYWNKNWIEHHLDELGSYQAIGRQYGYNPSVMSWFSLRNFALRRKQRYSSEFKSKLVKEYQSGSTYPSIATKYGVSVGSVYKWVKESKTQE